MRKGEVNKKINDLNKLFAGAQTPSFWHSFCKFIGQIVNSFLLRKKASPDKAGWLFSLVAELPQGLRVSAPVLVHPHREVQIDLHTEKAFQVLSCIPADGLDHAPSPADEDPLL